MASTCYCRFVISRGSGGTSAAEAFMNSRGGGEAARLEFELSPLTLCKIFTNVCPLDVTTEYEAISFSVTNFQDI